MNALEWAAKNAEVETLLQGPEHHLMHLFYLFEGTRELYYWPVPDVGDFPEPRLVATDLDSYAGWWESDGATARVKFAPNRDYAAAVTVWESP